MPSSVFCIDGMNVLVGDANGCISGGCFYVMVGRFITLLIHAVI